MAVYVVGEYLREMRTRRGYSQEAVSYNICTQATLSRIENGTSKNEKYPTIVYNISNWLGKLGRYEEALGATEDGINYCIRNGNLLRLAQLLFNKACALAELNKSVEAKSFFTQSITLFEVTKQYDKAQKAIEWCNGKYNINV